MVAAAKKTKKIKQEIPEEWIYEIWDGKPVYYAGYEDFISHENQINDIMPSSFLQVLIVSILVKFLTKKVDKNYFVVTNESGLHLGKNSNFANDIQIIEKSKVKDFLSNKYLDIPPKIVFEVDTKASLKNFEAKNDYFYQKTQKLLDFGVEKVVWVMSDVRKILVASQSGPWLIVNWNDDVDVFDGLHFNLTLLLQEEGVEI